MLIEPSELSTCIVNNIMIIDLCSPQQYQAGHIPNAIHVSPTELVSGKPPAPGKLPEKEKLDALFSRLGLTPEKHIVVYDDEGGGWAGRFIWTLDVIGHKNYSYLNGGLIAWHGDNLPLTQKAPEPTQTNYQTTIISDLVVTKEDILKKLGTPNLTVWDARSAEEFTGTRQTARRNGHIPNAIHCEWTELMDKKNNLRLRADIKDYLFNKGINSEKNIITHCHSHHRSGLTYLAGKILGFSIKAYPGSWSEWGNDPTTPIDTSY